MSPIGGPASHVTSCCFWVLLVLFCYLKFSGYMGVVFTVVSLSSDSTSSAICGQSSFWSKTFNLIYMHVFVLLSSKSDFMLSSSKFFNFLFVICLLFSFLCHAKLVKQIFVYTYQFCYIDFCYFICPWHYAWAWS